MSKVAFELPSNGWLLTNEIAAVLPFKIVVMLDLTRRDNSRKVMVVKLQMQRMICTLFQYVVLRSCV